VTRHGTGRAIKLEELAKIRYSFLWEPTLVHHSPKDLWTLGADGGAYEKAFGVDDALPELWSHRGFEQCCLATALYLQIESTIKMESQKDPRLAFMKRLRYHALALAGIYVKGTKEFVQMKELLHSKEVFDQEWRKFWDNAKCVLIDVHQTWVVENGSTLFAFVRSRERWQQMRGRFVLHAGLQD
jgi:hypothetical protein